MSSMQLILALVSSMLAWFQSYPHERSSGGVHYSELAQNRSATVIPEATGRKREFVVYDTTLYNQKPDLTRYRLQSVSMVSKSKIWPPGLDGASLPDRDLVRKAAAEANKLAAVAVLDIEHWPTTGDPAVVDENVRKYETLIRWFKEAAPSVKVGYYGVAPTRNYWDALQPTNSPRYIGWQKANDRVASIARLADILFPSVYTFNEDQDGWAKYAINQIQEARRYGGGKPVYVFLWNQYHDSNRKLAGKYLPPEYWRMELETARKYADGVVIWGGWHMDLGYPETWDEAAPWWLETKGFLQRLGSSGR